MSRSRVVEARPDGAISSRSTRRLAPVLRSLLETSGGFTLDVGATQLVRTGIAVCADPSASLTFSIDHWNDDVIEGWVTNTLDRRQVDDVHLGGWLEPLARRVWLDVVRVFENHHWHRAVDLARRNRQRAVFDLGRGAVVPLISEGLLG